MTPEARAAAYALAEHFVGGGASQVDVEVGLALAAPMVSLYGSHQRTAAAAEAVVKSLDGIVTERIEYTGAAWLEAVVSFDGQDVHLRVFHAKPDTTEEGPR